MKCLSLLTWVNLKVVNYFTLESRLEKSESNKNSSNLWKEIKWKYNDIIESGSPRCWNSVALSYHQDLEGMSAGTGKTWREWVRARARPGGNECGCGHGMEGMSAGAGKENLLREGHGHEFQCPRSTLVTIDAEIIANNNSTYKHNTSNTNNILKQFKRYKSY